MKIALAFLLSLLLIWGIGAVALTNPFVCEYDAGLGIPLQVEGTIKQERQENWVRTRIGKFGLAEQDSRRIQSGTVHCLIFGDSYIEAVMVEEQDRVQNVLSAQGIPSVGVGISGNSCVEVNHLMGIYNSLAPGVKTDVIVIADLSDILPPAGENNAEFAKLVPIYPFRRQEGKLGWITYRFSLQSFRQLIKKGKKLCCGGLDLRGNTWRNRTGPELPMFSRKTDFVHLEGYWRGMLRTLLKTAGNRQLVIVYVPSVPCMQNGKILAENPDQETIARFLQVCAEFPAICTVNMERRLLDCAVKTGRFPRGFFNTIPGEGHLNSEGHRILAEAIAEALAL